MQASNLTAHEPELQEGEAVLERRGATESQSIPSGAFPGAWVLTCMKKLLEAGRTARKEQLKQFQKFLGGWESVRFSFIGVEKPGEQENVVKPDYS